MGLPRGRFAPSLPPWRSHATHARAFCAFLAAASGCSNAPDAAPAADPALADAGLTREQRLERLLGVLAADSMRGRRTGSPENEQAARFLASELDRYGVEPAGENGFLQPVPDGPRRARGAHAPRAAHR